jgi:hypothetical protein
VRRESNQVPRPAQERYDEQEFLAILTDCALPADVSRVFDEYLTLDNVGGSEAVVVVHKALLGR